MTVKITHVGQKLWYVPSGRHDTAQSITVISLGRKWAQLSWRNMRAEIATGQIDGKEYGTPGRLYNNEKEYDDAVTRLNLIYRFSAIVSNSQSLAQVPTENIIAAAKLLGISLEAA